MNILLLDDDPILLPLATKVLTQSRPWKVHAATSLEEALERASMHRVDVVLVDASVGDSFASVVAALSAHPSLKTAKILVLTAKSDTLQTTLPVIAKSPGLSTLVEQLEKHLIAQESLAKSVDAGPSSSAVGPSLVDLALEHAYLDSRSFVFACSLDEPHQILWSNRAWNVWNQNRDRKITALISEDSLRSGDRERARVAAMEAIREKRDVSLSLNVKRSGDAVVSVHAKVFVSEGATRLWVIWQFAESPSIPPAHTELLSSMIDAVRSPLTEVRGSLGMLSGGLFGALNERVNEIVESAILQLDRSMVFLDDATLIEKASRDELRLSLQSTKADELIVLASTAHEVTSSDRSIHTSGAGSSLRVLVDARRVVQALIALLEHAASFSDEGSPPTIVAEGREQCVRFVVAPGRLRAAVSNASPSVDLKPFLSLRVRVARLIVELHNGRWGESSPGNHWIELPQAASGPSNTLRALAKEVVEEVRGELLATLPTQLATIIAGAQEGAVYDAQRRAAVTAHNLRGTAGSCGLTELGRCAGTLEELLRAIQRGERPANETLEQALDALTMAVQQAQR